MNSLIAGIDGKVCKVCKELKPLTEYHANKTCPQKVVGTCKICTGIRVRKWYADNRDRRQQLANERNQNRKKEWISKMGGRCFDCKGVFSPCVYDFHHIKGKDVNPSRALTWASDKIESELSKCVLLCANCHRLRHFEKGE